MAAGFMTHVTCRLTAKNWGQLQNPALGNRVWATFTFLYGYSSSQSNLPPGRGDIPALTPAEAGTRLSDPGGMQG